MPRHSPISVPNFCRVVAMALHQHLARNASRLGFVGAADEVLNRADMAIFVHEVAAVGGHGHLRRQGRTESAGLAQAYDVRLPYSTSIVMRGQGREILH